MERLEVRRCALTDYELIEILIKMLLYKPAWSKPQMKTISHRMKFSKQKLTSINGPQA
ncbi:MAG: hypothetical protein QGF90_14470 [Gammaproteobacteria bacterium]|jgi:hypothetical protein|nr:hypothetical protein [Gammaproteobacteria bacterium]|tara:strand:- start:299 stop:472 length:174 start_codon:yes stop_codon:yes gene_type:complete